MYGLKFSLNFHLKFDGVLFKVDEAHNNNNDNIYFSPIDGRVGLRIESRHHRKYTDCGDIFEVG